MKTVKQFVKFLLINVQGEPKKSAVVARAPFCKIFDNF